MWNVNARVERLDARSRRIIAVSDIHANMPYFRGLLEKINFSDSDELIIDGATGIRACCTICSKSAAAWCGTC